MQVKGAGLQEEQIAYICAESLKVSYSLAGAGLLGLRFAVGGAKLNP